MHWVLGWPNELLLATAPNPPEKTPPLHISRKVPSHPSIQILKSRQK